MSESVKELLQKFYDEHWPIPAPGPLLDSEMIEIDRKVWYCNISGNPIPEFQRFNKSGILLEYPTTKENDILSSEFYWRGDKAFRAYPCGHAFLDIHLLCAVFDAYVYRSDKIGIPKIFQDMGKTCLMCSNDDSCAGNVRNIYGVSGQYVGGTVHIKTTIPQEMLPYLKTVYEDGDVVDTGGYRGLDLYVLENGEFKKVETEGYYPIWTLDRAKKCGYRKLLSGLLWNDEAQFDLIELDHGLKLTPYNELTFDDEPIKANGGKVSNVVFDENQITIGFNGGMRMLEKNGKFYQINTPFDSAEEYIFYLGIGLPLQIKVSDYDYLTIDLDTACDSDEEDSESCSDGDHRTHRTIYFTDLNGENRLDLSFW